MALQLGHPGLSLSRYASVENAVLALTREAAMHVDFNQQLMLAAAFQQCQAAADTAPLSVPQTFDAASLLILQDDMQRVSTLKATSPAATSPAALPSDSENDSSSDVSEAKRQKKGTSAKVTNMAWSTEEDEAILDAVNRLGTQWPRIAEEVLGRTADGVRNRWHRLRKRGHMSNDAAISCAFEENLVPSIPAEVIKGAGHGRSMWEAKEDALIEEGVRRVGCKWRKVAEALPGRSDSSVRNRWMRLQEQKEAPEKKPVAKAATVKRVARKGSPVSLAEQPRAVTAAVVPIAVPVAVPIAVPIAPSTPVVAHALPLPATLPTHQPPKLPPKLQMKRCASHGAAWHPLVGYGIA